MPSSLIYSKTDPILPPSPLDDVISMSSVVRHMAIDVREHLRTVRAAKREESRAHRRLVAARAAHKEALNNVDLALTRRWEMLDRLRKVLQGDDFYEVDSGDEESLAPSSISTGRSMTYLGESEDKDLEDKEVIGVEDDSDRVID